MFQPSEIKAIRSREDQRPYQKPRQTDALFIFQPDSHTILKALQATLQSTSIQLSESNVLQKCIPLMCFNVMCEDFASL